MRGHIVTYAGVTHDQCPRCSREVKWLGSMGTGGGKSAGTRIPVAGRSSLVSHALS